MISGMANARRANAIAIGAPRSARRVSAAAGSARQFWLAALLLTLIGSHPLTARAWIDAAWPMRRPVDVDWEAEKAPAGEIAVADFYTGGHHRPDGADVRVATADNRVVPSRVVMVGPGDKVRVAFSLTKGIRRYFVYFGNPMPPAPVTPKAGQEPWQPTAGLFMEMRQWLGGPPDSPQQLADGWAKAKEHILGRTVLDRASIGVNPFGEQQQTISRMTGTLTVDADGDYQFALSADDRGAIFIDGKMVLFANGAPGDAQINAQAALKKGVREFVLYHMNAAGDGRIVVVWRRLGVKQYQLIGPESLGKVHHCTAGPLEEVRKTLVADFDIRYEGEAFFADGYAHRYTFTANAPKVAGKPTYEWDFGDGAPGGGAEVRRVFLADGLYPVKLTVRVGGNSDTQVTTLAVSRDWEHSDKPIEDKLTVQAGLAASLDVNRIPPAWAPRLAWMNLRADRLDAALAACGKVAALPKQGDPGAALNLLRETADAALAKGMIERVLVLWQQVPPESNLQPTATLELAQILLWRVGDAPTAATVLGRFATTADNHVKRTYAQSLLLAGRVDEATKLLKAIPPEGDPAKHPAISGASARTVEFYITAGDAESGEEAWDLWQARYPADFLQGYAVLLKTRLMELKKCPVGAAHIAEAFARAEPESAYCPQLLDRASKLLAESDATRSQALRKLLKDRYPEDPLSQ